MSPHRALDSPRARHILARVRALPAGCVTTYGDLCPEAPRLAGSVLAASSDPALPWHRVVRADGSVAKGERQLRLLVAEGIPVSRGRVRMREAWVDVEGLAA